MTNGMKRSGNRGSRPVLNPEAALAKVQAAAEELTVRRYASPIQAEPKPADQREQMEELNRVLDYQNRILAEVLGELGRLRETIEKKGE